MRSKAIFMALLAFAFGDVEAARVTVSQASQAARAWASAGSGRRLGAKLGTSVEGASTLSATNGLQVHLVKLSGGTVLMSGDTEFEPVLAFTSEKGDCSSIDPKSPLWALLNADLARQQRAVQLRRLVATSSGTAGARTPSESRWTALLGGATPGVATATGARPISEDADVLDDLRVGILLKTKWGQSTLSGRKCFNYYTPGNCVCGCVATAFAQTMRYHRWPEGEVASFSGACMYKGVSTNLTTTGGVFDWENMPKTALTSGNEETEAQAIGRLTFECGVAVDMMYAMPDGSGSGASTDDVVPALTEKFGYASARWYGDTGSLSNDETIRERYVYPSLDAGCPVIFSIRGPGGGHAVVGDGYGYDMVGGAKTPYIHLNMGWTSQNDWWYNFPNIATGSNPEKFDGFDEINGVAYDIFPEKTGRIVSGRVLDIDGEPAAGVTVQLNGLEATTTETGVFAFIVTNEELPPGTYKITSSKDGALGELEVNVGPEGENGDCWGNEIELRNPSVRIARTGTEYSTLDFAIDAAENDDVLEILKPSELRKPRLIGVNCTIRPADEGTVATNFFAAGATLTVSNGVRVLFENVVFQNAAKHVALTVREDGTAAVRGSVGVDEIDTVTTNGFELAGAIDTAFFLDCKGQTKPKDVIGLISADVASLGDCTMNIRNKYNEELGGTVDEEGNLIWGAQPVPDAAAVVQLFDADGVTYTNYLSLGTLFNYVKPGATIVVRRDCSMTNAVEVTDDLAIVGTAGCVISSLQESSFWIYGGTLTVSNAVFSGYSADGLFNVDNGAKLVLADGARIVGQPAGSMAEAFSAVTVFEGAEVTLQPGCEIRDWESRQPEYECGGGVTVYAGGVLNLYGGRITGCRSLSYGGGIYIASGATVNLQGSVEVKGNEASRDPTGTGTGLLADDICCCDADSVFRLTGKVTSPDGSIGVSYYGTDEESGNREGDSFITVATDAQSATNSAAKFFCTVPERETKDTMVGAVSEDGATLVWEDVGKRCSPEDAVAAVIYAGEDGMATNYYRSVEDAFNELNVKIEADATVEILKSTNFPAGLVVQRSVLLCSHGAMPLDLTLSSGGDCGFLVGSGSSLVISNLTVGGADLDTTLVWAKGGSLTLAAGATLQDVAGVSYGTSGVSASDGATFTMERDSAILSCRNAYANEYGGFSTGGGLWANDTTVRLNGGQIAYCKAVVGGGVYFTPSCDVRISGDVEIAANNNVFVKDVSEGPNLYASSRDQITLAGDFTGSVGVVVDGSTNVFGKVDAAYFAAASVDDLTAGAAHFYRNLPGDDKDEVKGCVVTNGAVRLLVWKSALETDPETGKEYYEDDDETRYGLVDGEVPPVPVIVDPDPIAFESITRISDTEWKLIVTNIVPYCNYRLLWTKDLTKGFTSTGDWAQAAADAPKAWTTNVVTEGGAWFWRAEGKEGQKD